MIFVNAGSPETVMMGANMYRGFRLQWARRSSFGKAICVHLRSSAVSLAFEFGFHFGEEGLVADLEILGAEARKALVVLGRSEGAGIAHAPRELLVPARHQGRALSDALRSGARFGFHFAVGHHARDEPLVLRLARVENAALQQDLERGRL